MRALLLTPTTCLSVVPAQAQSGGGTGKSNHPYRIETATQLISVGADPNLWDRHFMLVNDIDLDPNPLAGKTFNKTVIAPDVERVPLPNMGAFIDACILNVNCHRMPK